VAAAVGIGVALSLLLQLLDAEHWLVSTDRQG
jgi:hypothetical protein